MEQKSERSRRGSKRRIQNQLNHRMHEEPPVVIQLLPGGAGGCRM